MANPSNVSARPDAAVTATNLPFQSRIAYRTDDYSSLRYKLLMRMAEVFDRWNGNLAGNQGQQDMGVALIEMFAYMAEVLSFYQDCRANEAYLRTARLPASLVELCALIDYRIPPGAAASTIQTFRLKTGQTGVIPAGFQVKTKARDGVPEMVFETAQDLSVDALLDDLHFAGYDRSLRKLNATGQPKDTTALLDSGYDGLKAGGFAIFSVGGKDYPVQLTAVTTQQDKRRITWPATAISDLDLPVADLAIHGKPKQSMWLADKARADEITAGQRTARVKSPGVLAAGHRVVFVSQALKLPARILSVKDETITWDHGFPVSLRCSQTRVYTAGGAGIANGRNLRVGNRTVTAYSASDTASAGEYLLISGEEGMELALVESVKGNTYFLVDPLPRSFALPTLFHLRLDDLHVRVHGNHGTELAPLTTHAADITLTLDKTYEGLEAGKQVVITDGVHTGVNYVAAVRVDGEDRTVLTLKNALGAKFNKAALAVWGPFEQTMRVDGYNRAESGTPAGLASVTLSGVSPGLKPGGYLVFEGGGHAEAARILALRVDSGNLVADLETALTRSYPLGDTVISGNAAPVTHGATIVEASLGSGDHSQESQRFTLRQRPITHVNDASALRGVSSTLQIFVDGQQWRQVESLSESGPEDRHYMLDIDDEQNVTVVFGDGRQGAKLPTGRDNVRARYRVGLGSAGNVDAGAIVTAPAPLPFLESTRNPIQASGGADRETVEDTRRIAPVTVQTLDRAVSLSDYAGLALSYAGIAKARADWDWEGSTRSVRLTVATVGGHALTPALERSLHAYLDARRAPGQRLRIRDYRPWPVRLSLDIQVLPDYLRAETKLRVERALGSGLAESGERGYFHFDSRDLGQALYLSDVYGLVEKIPGVDYVIAREFHASSAAGTVLDRVDVPVDALATGGHPSDVSVGVLSVRATGGIA